MLKWFALILVATVLCWGDTHSHSSTGHNESGRAMEKARPSRPVEERKIDAEAETLDALSADDKKELDKLIKELDSVGKNAQSQTGEQNSGFKTTTPNL